MADAKGLARLWAPWRMAYIESAAELARHGRTSARKAPGRSPRARAVEKCLFCSVRAAKVDRPHLVLARRPNALLMLNRFPYSPGHLMVAVARHAARFGDLVAEEAQDLIELTALAERALAREYRPHGMNYGANVGRVAGAGFPGHLHLHLVPRWNGDTNFMPTVAGTKVLPESLGRTWTRLRRVFREIETAAPRARSQRSRAPRRTRGSSRER